MATKISVANIFNRLFTSAAGVNKTVASLKFDTEKYTTLDQLNRAIRHLGFQISQKLESAGVEPGDIEPEVAELMTYISKIGAEPEAFECKPPLTKHEITFKDIAGLGDVKTKLEVYYIQPFIYPLLFPTVAKGILFYGVPGGGKSLLAKAATAEINDAAFFGPTPGELRGKYEGETERNIDTVFKCGERILKDPNSEYKISIIFFDEFDSIGGKRGDDPSMTRSVNALLQNMDGIKMYKNVSVIAATNYPWSLDDAILRRFTTRIFIDLPDEEAIEFLIRDALVSAYSNPNLNLTEKRATLRNSKGDFDQDAPYMKYIATFGGYTETTKGWGTTTTEQKYITNMYIRKLIDKFGPNVSGKQIIDEIKSGQNVETDDRRLLVPTHIFGYSPSDITKVMEMAVNIASTRALQGYAKKTKVPEWNDIPGLSKLSIEKLFELAIEKGIRISERDSRAALISLIKNEGVFYITSNLIQGVKISELKNDVEAKKIVVNFDIRQSDVEEALKNLSSTVDNIKYVELLKYSRQA